MESPKHEDNLLAWRRNPDMQSTTQAHLNLTPRIVLPVRCILDSPVPRLNGLKQVALKMRSGSEPALPTAKPVIAHRSRGIPTLTQGSLPLFLGQALDFPQG